MLLKKLLLPALVLICFNLQAQNVPAYVPSEGLVGWWPFTGNAIDSSGNGNNGIVVSAVLANDRFGKSNGSYSFNGTNSRIEVADAVSLRCRKITLSVWVNTNTAAARQIIYKATMTADGEAYGISGASTAFKVGSNCVTATGWQGTNFQQSLTTGSWEHLLVTFDGTTLKLYKNGVLDNTTILSGLIDSCVGGGVRFGFNHLRYNASTGDPFNGLIDDIGIWNRALTQQEVSHLYSASLESVGNIGVNISSPQRSLHVNDVLRLEPRSTPPPSPSKGDIYFDSTLNKLRVYDGTVWQNCW
jgi:hypothetical protein